MHVLIAGGGIVGLTIAQGFRESGIPCTVYEQDTKESRHQGWALTMHWCLEALERTIGAERAARLPSAVVDPTLKNDTGEFLFLNAETGQPRYKIAPSKRRLRLHRQKLRAILADGVDVREGKRLVRVEVLPGESGGVRAHFADGTSADGSVLIGADGNNSKVRQFLRPSGSALHPLPVHLVGVVRHFTAEQGAAVRAINPLLFQALHPQTGSYLWYSVQDVQDVAADDAGGFDALVIVSWVARDAATGEPVGPDGTVAPDDRIPASDCDRIAMMKRRTADYAEPLRSIVHGIADDLTPTTPLRLADYPVPPDGTAWDNHSGRVTLAGDSAHAMTMYRGEGANHGILDAALLVDQLRRVQAGELDAKTALDGYEAEMQPRGHAAVMQSRQAALVAHDWAGLTPDSAVIAGRTPPETAIVKVDNK